MHSLKQHCQEKPVVTEQDASSGTVNAVPTKANVIEHNWAAAYATWRRKVYDNKSNEGKIPNEKQSYILRCVHDRCVQEATRSNDDCPAPFLRFVHGLPGSGKSKLLQWLRSYYEEVWQWVEGREFVFLAPLNSMACDIGGRTVHGWGQVAWQDKRGVRMVPTNTSDTQDSSTMTIRCGALRWM